MMIRGKNIKFTVRDIADGYTIVNPIFLKPIDGETLKELYQEITKGQAEIRRDFPRSDAQALRMRNMKLQRLHSATIVIRNFARQKKVLL